MTPRTNFLINECKRKIPISQKKRKNSFTLLFLSNLIVYIQRPSFKSTISCTAGVILVRIIPIHMLYRLLTIQGTLKRCKISQEKTISHPFEGLYTLYMLYQNNCNVPYDMLLMTCFSAERVVASQEESPNIVLFQGTNA